MTYDGRLEVAGDRVAGILSTKRGSDEEFASAASDALVWLLESGFAGLDLLDVLVSSASLPSQQGSSEAFGQPAVTLFLGDGFQIDALLWRGSGTALHSHAFAGSFAVWHGESVHAEYRADIGPLEIGSLRRVKARQVKQDLLKPGCVRTIVPGASNLHALIHLGRPSISLVIKGRHRDPTDEMVVLGTELGVHLAGVTNIELRRVTLLETLVACQSPRVEAVAVDLAHSLGGAALLRMSEVVLDSRIPELIHAFRGALLERMGSLGSLLLSEALALKDRRRAERLLCSSLPREARMLLASAVVSDGTFDLIDFVVASLGSRDRRQSLVQAVQPLLAYSPPRVEGPVSVDVVVDRLIANAEQVTCATPAADAASSAVVESDPVLRLLLGHRSIHSEQPCGTNTSTR